MSYNEISDYASACFTEDFEVFKRLVTEQKEVYDSIRFNDGIKQLIEKVRCFYEDIISDGYLKKDPCMFERENIEADKLRQVRDEATTLVNGNLWVEAAKNYSDFFMHVNRAYALYYESLIAAYLSPLSQKIVSKPLSSKAIILEKLIEYKKGKHTELFRSLIPQIRNSIQHADYIISRTKPEITFYDQKKEPLTLSLLDYKIVFWEIWHLTIAFDIVTWDIEYPFSKYMIEQVEVVQNFLKTHDVKLIKSDNSRLSLLDWASLIKSSRNNEL